MSLEISMRESGEVIILDLTGKATIGVDNDFLKATVGKLLAQGVRKVLLNLAKVSQVDSSSIGTIAGTYLHLRHQGGSMKLLSPRGRVRLALEVMRLLHSIPTFEDETQALASFDEYVTPAKT